jgi:hypothetical protein
MNIEACKANNVGHSRTKIELSLLIQIICKGAKKLNAEWDVNV